ncbi:VWA domain-containing protein [Klebsiella aerogenes]|uniref:VWA domain-containing protein n=1 Tax=Klebsiella aerogenes TaxID=548 RepID=UPI000E2E9EFF|nr:VWA domain-containing protein [Klebsiella aerogenes]
MSDFHFLYPWHLTALLLCVLVAWLPGYGASAWSTLMDKPFRALIIQRRRRLTRLLPWLLALGVIALAGPSWQRELPAALTPQSNVMVILQQDLAMYAQDLPPSRHQRMQHKIAALMQRQPGSHFGLVVYSSQAFLTTPLTQDPQFYQLFLNAQSPSLLPEGSGSALPQAVALALKNLPTDKDSPRSLILVADTLSPADVAWLKGQHLPLQIWVPGTAAGGMLSDKYASLGIDTRLNVDRFRQLRDAGIPVTLASDDGDDLPIIASHIQQSVTQQNNAREDLHWKNSGYLLIAPMLFLLLFWRRQLLMVALLFPALLWSPHSDAAWLDAWVRPDIQGQHAFRRGDYAAAAGHYRDPLWQGIAWYRAGDYPAAASAFRAAPPTAETLLWLGNSYAQQKQWQQALDSYDRALYLHPDWSMALQNRDKISQIVMGIRQQERERQQAQGDAMDDGPDKLVHDLQKNQGIDQQQIGAIAGESPQVNQWFDALDVSPTGLLKSLYRNGSGETAP